MYKPVIDILESRGSSDYIGESVTQIEHAVQAGYFGFNYIITASRSYDRRYFVVACLLHDIGHLLKKSDFPNDVSISEMIDPETSLSLGVQSHEHIGSAYLRLLGYPEVIPSLLEAHVDAKRYRVAKDTSYSEKLSEASRRTLRLQGGPMNDEECLKFESHPLFSDRLALRQCDESSKLENIQYADVDIENYWQKQIPLDVMPNLNSYRNWMKRVLEN